MTDHPSRKYLFTPYVGLHSLLLRSPKLNLDQDGLRYLTRLLFIDENQERTQTHILQLIGRFPPPHLIHTLLSSQPILKTNIDIHSKPGISPKPGTWGLKDTYWAN
ncbi:hypothetical protein BLNAU_8732 [Blattamonas nauphoetae]|uniref:Uncharacterized protein n=1 Tax=Blattamonas nauphoetae TaxID=2049346 RepID=A0ABQ9XY20_9EUKA|nr:hypothetical protein BLNAU_8732 [Blattamonas nauphoetae]